MTDDWQKYSASAEESAGGKFTTGREYLFTVRDIELQKDVIIGGPGMQRSYEMYRGKRTSDIPIPMRGEILPAWTTDYFVLHAEEGETGATMRVSFNVRKITVNPKNTEFESRIVTFLRNMGYEILPKQEILFGKYFRVGMTFTAELAPQVRGGKETGYYEIDIKTARPATTRVPLGDACDALRAADAHQRDTSPAVGEGQGAARGEIDAVIAGAQTKDDAICALVEKRRNDLVGIFLSLIAQGEYPQYR